MTYAEAISLRDAIETALLNNSGAVSVSIGDRSISYGSAAGMRTALAELNRSIQAYDRRASGKNPNTVRAKWVR